MAAAQPLDLLDQSGGQHGVEARRDARVQRRAIGGQQGEAVQRERQLGARLRVQGGQRCAGGVPDFERALHALRVAGGQSSGRGRVDARELGMQSRPAVLRGLRFELCAQRRIGRRQFVHAERQRAVVEHGAADQQRRMSARAYGLDRGQRVGAEATGGIALGGLDQVDQVMRHARPLGRVRLGRADVHAAVDLSGIDADDLDADACARAFGERHGERGFARCGGTQQADDGEVHRMVARRPQRQR